MLVLFMLTCYIEPAVAWISLAVKEKTLGFSYTKNKNSFDTCKYAQRLCACYTNMVPFGVLEQPVIFLLTHKYP